MADSTVKTIQLKGDAAEAYKSLKNGTRKRRGRKSRVQEGGFDDIPGPEIGMRQIDTTHATQLSKAANITKVGGAVTQTKEKEVKDQRGGAVVNANVVTTPSHAIVNKPAETPAINASKEAGTLPTPNPTIPSTQQGGKLVLAPKKKKTGAILLAPPKKLTGTRSTRSSKKIRVQLSNMKKRITTAKVIHKESKEKSIEEIRKLLEEAKLVKPASSGKKVPDDILRNIYRDYLILRNKAL